MGTRRTNGEKRCPRCDVYARLCFCDELNHIENKTFVTVVMHFREAFLTTNTAKLGSMTMDNFEIIKRGRHGLDEDFELRSDCEPLLLFPSERSVELTPALITDLKRPVQLIVPDGTWRQAKRIGRRDPKLKNIKHVHLPQAGLSQYGLRKQLHGHGLCTYEAIARALSLLEEQEYTQACDENLGMMVERVLLARGMYMLWPRQRHIDLMSSKNITTNDEY